MERYEAIVSDHQQYSKAVMDTQEWLDATHNTVLLWGDMDLERISLHTNLERLKVMGYSLVLKSVLDETETVITVTEMMRCVCCLLEPAVELARRRIEDSSDPVSW